MPVTIGLDRPELLGTLTVGYLLDDERAASFKALTGADIAFAIDGEVRASTLGHEAHAAPRGAPRRPTWCRASMIGDIEYAALVKPLRAPRGRGVATDPPCRIAIVLRSRTERMRTLSAIQTGLGLVALATVLLAVAVSYGVARTITRPLAPITDHMRQVAATGDLTRKLRADAARAAGRTRMRGCWPRPSTRLTDSIAQFQREAAQRERLSSLGRMSTIVAHEIRNPLMIIKGALRQLTREGATAADIREAAADIDGEIERLNRVVNEVLDFARPMRFDRTPTDINALCRDAACAVAAAQPDPPVAIEFDPSVPALQTDSEKLRTVLVNLLTNAQAGRRRADAATPTRAERRQRVAVDGQAGRSPRGHRRFATAASASGPMTCRASSIPTSRRAGPAPASACPSPRTSSTASAGTSASTARPGAGTSIRIELGDAPLSRT